MKKIRVLYLEGNKDGTVGGSHYSLLRLIDSLDKDKYYPIVILLESNDLVESLKVRDIDVLVCPLPTKGYAFRRKNKKIYFGVLTNLFSFIMIVIQKAINFLRIEILPFIVSFVILLRYRINILHLNNSIHFGVPWVLASRLLGIKIVIHHRVHFKEPSTASRINGFIASHVFCVSKSIKDDVISLGVPCCKCSVIYDAVEPDNYRVAGGDGKEIRQEFSVTDRQPLIVIVGNLKRWKGQNVLVDALGMLPEKKSVKCLIVGASSTVNSDDMQFNKELTKAIEDLKLTESVSITGYRNDIPAILSACDVFVHTSVSPEPFGLVILEAMRAGKAIIATDQGGPAEIIQDGLTGFLITPNRPDLLAEKLSILINDKQKCVFLGAMAKKRFEEHFLIYNIDLIEKVYSKLLSRA